MFHFPEPTAGATPEGPAKGVHARRWSAELGHMEPVHDALVAARLDALQAGRPHLSTLGADSGEITGAHVRRTPHWAIRHRLGRAIAGFGHFIEGDPEGPDSASPSGVA